MPSGAGHLFPIAAACERFGWTGVDLFFVLSGFLIGGLLFLEIQRTGHLEVKRFLIRRGFKIWPPYFFFLALVIAGEAWQRGSLTAAARPLFPNLLHLQNYLGSSEVHTWSLAVEEHFYVALPVLLLLLSRLGRVSWVPTIIGVICVVCLGLRVMNAGRPYSLYTHYTPTHLRADSLFFGVLLAYLFHLRPSVLAFVPRYRGALLAGGVVLLLPMVALPVENPFVFTVGFTMVYLGYGCILIACVDSTTGLLGRLLAGRPARVLGFIGFSSYSIYLWHLPITNVLRTIRLGGSHDSVNWIIGMIVYILLSTMVGVVAVKLVEQPALKTRDRWFPRDAAKSTLESAHAPGAELLNTVA
jgi:peptidoglycan/LPS O-acetylase OafA/YrhL